MAWENPYGKIGYNELSPYVQKLLRTAGTGEGNIFTDRSYQIIRKNTDNISINMVTYSPESDDVLVFLNGSFLTLGIDYQMGSGKNIVKVGGEWEATQETPIVFDFYCIGNAKKKDQVINFVKINILDTDTGWVEEDGVYYKIVPHNLNSDNVIVTAIDSISKKSLQEVYTIVDNNNIKIYNEKPLNISLTIIDVTGSHSGNGSNNGQGISLIVNADAFSMDDTEGMYKTIINHGLSSDNLVIGIMDTNNRSVYLAYDRIDNNSIVLYNTVAESLTLSILPL